MAKHRKTPSIGKTVADLWRTVTSAFDTYHPEQHYMRGPGPKWRAKHAAIALSAEPGLGGMAKVSV